MLDVRLGCILRVIRLTPDESRQHYDSQFAKLVPGQFFQPTMYRLFYVKERRPDNMAVIVHELSNLENTWIAVS